MFDFEDASDVTDFAILATPGGCMGLLFVIAVAIAAYGVAYSNADECETTRSCPPGSVVRLQNHECQCVIAPPPKEGP